MGLCTEKNAIGL